MVTSVIELADKLFKAALLTPSGLDFERGYIGAMSRICANANDIGLPLSVVQQLLKGTDYEQLLS